MNKVFKVVWSKVKHCYVVVSELAKNTISGGAKNSRIGTSPLVKGLALGMAMTFVITGNAWADVSIVLPKGNEADKVTNAELQSAGLQELKDFRFIGNSGAKVANIEIEANKDFYRDGDLQLWTGFTQISEGTVSNCHFIINNNKMNFGGYLELTGAHIAGAEGQKAYNNSININYATVESKVALGFYGGLANPAAKGSVLEKNNLEIYNSTLTYNCNNYLHLYGAANNAGSANENTLNIDKLYINGYDESDLSGRPRNFNTIICGGEGEYKAEGNIVTIKNTDLSEVLIYGGKVAAGEAKDNEVHFNNVTIQASKIYGGYIDGSGIVSGNRLFVGENIFGKASLISSFNEVSFKNLKWKADGKVIETESLVLGDENNKTIVKVNGLAEGSDPKKGELMTLIDVDAEATTGCFDESTSTFNSGDFLKAEGKIYQDAEDIKLKITRVGTNDQALVIGESRAAATAFANQGSELIEIGLDTLARDKSEKETKVFASVYGNTSEYATGSHVKVNGWSGIVGVAKTSDDGLTTGAFFENGEGNYRTFNTFEGDFMRGDGEANYNGGGFFARKDNANGVYTEASLRAGNLQNELRKAVIADNKLEGYDINTFYYGAHVGVGKIVPRGNEGDSIDVYGKFIYTHHDSEDFAIGRDNFHFDSVDSERLRLGFRINEVQNDKLSMYYGAAWEYEFGGDADNTVVGYDLTTPSLGGSTVIGEVGMHYNASKKWSFDMNARAYGGRRDGFSGSIQANYRF